MTEMFAIFVEPFQFTFMQNALLTALVVAVICALLSCYLVLKDGPLMGMPFLMLSYLALSLAFLAGIPLVIGAFVSGIACALGVGYFKRKQPYQRRYRNGDCIFGNVCHWFGVVH